MSASSSLSPMIPSISSERRRSASGASTPGSQQRDDAADRTVGGAVDQVHRVDAVAEHALALADGVVDVGAGAVELGDDDGARHADRGALLPQLHGRGVDAVDRGDDEQGRVGGAETGPELAHEVRAIRGCRAA